MLGDPDPAGTGLNDETAFKIEHADWGSNRAHLPGICWRYNEDEENNPRPSNDPGYMRFKGMVVLDPNDDPVKDWPQLPATLSSKTRGYRLEIMSRENPHLEYKDCKRTIVPSDPYMLTMNSHSSHAECNREDQEGSKHWKDRGGDGSARS